MRNEKPILEGPRAPKANKNRSKSSAKKWRGKLEQIRFLEHFGLHFGSICDQKGYQKMFQIGERPRSAPEAPRRRPGAIKIRRLSRAC